MTHHENIDISALLVGGDMVALFDGTRAIAAPSPEDTVDHGHDDDAEALECLTALRSLMEMRGGGSPLDQLADALQTAYGQGNGTFMVV